MVAVGFWASTVGGKARRIVPSAFVWLMAVGGVMGSTGVPLPMVETSTALAVAVLGLLVAFEVKVPAHVAAAVVGVSALFHGHAQGIELPAMAYAGGYVAGFLAATTALHAVGIGLASLRFGKAGHAAMRMARSGGSACRLNHIPGRLLPIFFVEN
ncbi:urease accessory protein [Sinorhizobium kostiense]|uniref:Urease accessory protein n=1 Tax=Sinorhizobium kostiense TaxID=76747 RepID=A0ABS4R009_9HYPH|nr:MULTISPECIES: HupE/UreJ family protein [Sinorhizobium]MBP2236225.1 urease accessory protein [Sinorhizobium kostiense]